MNNNQKPRISLFGPAIRTNLWKSLYDKTVSENKISLEFVFVGSNKPKFKLPNNFKFIYSNVKPVQCFQIALMECSAELVFPIGDDTCFSKNLFDILYKKHILNLDEKVVYGVSFVRGGRVYQRKDYHLMPTHVKEPCKNSPEFPASSLLKKKDVMELGGFDRNFIGGCALADLFLRLIESGKIFHRIKDIFMEEVTINTFKKDLISKFFYGRYPGSKIHKVQKWLPKWLPKFLKSSSIPKAGQYLFTLIILKHDVPVLNSLWIAPFNDNISQNDVYCIYEDVYLSKKRLRPLEPFNHMGILIKSQGPTDSQWS